MYYRKIIGKMRKWAQKRDRKPLIIRGARQVGKTTAVNLFAKDFKNYIYLNLEQKKDKDFFSHDRGIDEVIAAIFFSRNIQRKDAPTLLFLDEIQNSSEAVALLRFFYEQAGDIFVVAAGSLLESLIDKHINFPVGRVEYLFIFPMDFEEFLLAQGETDAVKHMHTIPFPAFAYEKIARLFYQYSLLGGMPEIIVNYLVDKDMVALGSIYRNLFITYTDDVEKYAKNDSQARIIRHVIESIPYNTGKRIKFQGFGNSAYRSREIGVAFRVLEKAMLLKLLYPTTALSPPLVADLKKAPRLQFLDTGLMNFFVGLQDYFFKSEDLNDIYRGILAEHIIGQELISLFGDTLHKITFWVREKKESVAEVDFIIPFKNRLIPIEVKSGKTGTLKSLFQFMNNTDHEYALRFYDGEPEMIRTRTPEGKEFNLLNLPFFLVENLFDYLEWMIAKT